MDIVAKQLSDPHVLAVQNCPWHEQPTSWRNISFIYTSRNWKAKVGLPHHKKPWLLLGMSEMQPCNGWLSLTREWCWYQGWYHLVSFAFSHLSTWNNLVKVKEKCLTIVVIIRLRLQAGLRCHQVPGTLKLSIFSLVPWRFEEIGFGPTPTHSESRDSMNPSAHSSNTTDGREISSLVPWAVEWELECWEDLSKKPLKYL